jgi:hypothetical protein
MLYALHPTFMNSTLGHYAQISDNAIATKANKKQLEIHNIIEFALTLCGGLSMCYLQEQTVEFTFFL